MDDIRLHDCIQACWKARHVCQETLFRHCLPIGGPHVDEMHVKLMTDCMEICQAAADFMTRDSAYYGQLCDTCADVCDACAKACDRIGDEAMMRCVEACRACAKSCRDITKLQAAA